MLTTGRHVALHRFLWLLPVAAFMVAIAAHIQLPGLYMDAVNPDYLAAQKLHPHLHNPTGTLPSKIFPILGSLYHGVQNFYVDLPLFALFGFQVAVVRTAQALFGAVLLVAFFIAIRRLAGSSWLALIGSLGLATEIAFTASFRSQFYIVMGGATWLFVSLMLALASDEDSARTRKRLFWSGFFAGLAGYGYFVLLFFMPGMLALVALRPGSRWRDTMRWILGLAAGCLPFVLGYVSLTLKLHGIGPAMAFVHDMLGALHPFQGGGSNGSNLLYAWRMARLAITNDGNDAMIFGYALPSWWGVAKFYLFVACMLGLSATAVGLLALRRTRPAWVLVGLLPLSYLLVASLFGPRLWAHHFCVLVPFVYMLPLAVLANTLSGAGTHRAARTLMFGLMGAGCLAGNLTQQADFHAELSRSGGEGMSTSALTQLAVEARGVPSDTAYVFPDWGFFTSFCLLTGNKVRYVTDVAPTTLQELRRKGYDDLRVVYWQPAERDRYVQALRQAGLPSITERRFTTLDGRPVFYWLEGRPQPVR